ncbi:hypothetical protein NIES4071_44000 [Calothrix sp. NIES-4071]|nr:hypothetical protein NIES4071_44000 [Calothrix sp. NIES-4071]BAZ58714.1 hypothetical protein NIES4105_43930 [Calothrix sp. NIES-4105]
MMLQDVTSLLVCRNLINEIIYFVQTNSAERLFKKEIDEAQFNQIFTDVELKLCEIADEMAIIINEQSVSSVTIYQQQINTTRQKLQEFIENTGNSQILIQKLCELVDYFHNLLSQEEIYPETPKILDGIKAICTQY